MKNKLRRFLEIFIVGTIFNINLVYISAEIAGESMYDFMRQTMMEVIEVPLVGILMFIGLFSVFYIMAALLKFGVDIMIRITNTYILGNED